MKKTIILLTIMLISCLTGFCSVSAQETEYTEVDASALSAGQPFRFTVTIGSDESLSFSGAQARLTAILCPAEQSTGDCQVMNQVADGEDSTSMRITFEVDSLPAEGDYTLQISFRDETGTFETRSVNYLLKGVKKAAEEPPSDIVPEIVTSVRVVPALVDTEGTSLIYGSTVYVNEPYTLQITADSSMNNSVALQVALPASLLSAPLDPSSECLQYLNEEGTALVIPGSRWDASDGNTFACELRFNDSAYLAANPLEFSLINPTGSPNGYEETYEMEKLSWNYYPVNIAKFPATHQLQISDSRGNLICSDNVPCGVFNADDVYVMTYKFPSDWGAVMPEGKTLTAEVEWPEDWAAGLSLPDSLEIASEFGEACTVGPDGRSTFTLEETEPGRYSASCTFVPSGIASPTQAQALIHLDDNSYQVSDLKVWLPGTIVKTQAVLTPSLSLRMTGESDADEQIQNGTIGKLYRTAGEFPNSDGGSAAPALYTLRAEISGVSSSRRPQPGDAVNVKWPVLDSLAATGDLPACLMPSGDGYTLGTLEKTEEGTWRAECDLRFPETMDADVQGGTLQMDLVSGAYQTSAKVQVAGTPFTREPLYVDLNVPDHMVLMQDTSMSVRISDGSGGYSDYLRAVLAASGGAGLQAEWEYNMFTDCNGVYTLGDDGIAVCSAHFDMPTDMESDMHFALTAPALDRLFDVQFRPAADIHIAAVSKMDAELTPGLGLRMTADAAETDQLAGGSIGTLYRTSSDFANSSADGNAPALYTLSASVSGMVPGSEPQPGDYVEVTWPLLDAMAAAGDIPSCLTAAGNGYMLGDLEAQEDGTWSASCDFRFPMSMSSDTAGAPLSMELVAAAYNGSARVEMNGQAFKQEPLYVDINVPETIPLRLAADLHVRVSDSTGGLSDYTRAVLQSADISLVSDWAYNYVTDCQGLFHLDENGEAACSAYFELPADESEMHFELAGLDAAQLFDVEFRPGADIRISGIDKTQTALTPSLAMRMTPDSPETSEIRGGVIGTLYRSTGEFPNADGTSDAPALYSLKAEIGGTYPGSAPEPDDYVLVRWSLLDELAMTGDLPSCLMPDADGFILGSLTADEGGTWSASCDFRFPATMATSVQGSPMEMELVSGAYEGSARVEMSGQPFHQDTLYVNLDIPSHMLLRQMTEFHVRVTDSSGGLSDYASAVLNSSGVSLISDWDYNYVTTCQGLYELTVDGESSCSAIFEVPTSGSSVMHFDLISPALENLFTVEYLPSADIHVDEITNIQAMLTVKLLHDGSEIALPAMDDAYFEVLDDYQLQFILTPAPDYQDVVNAVSVDSEGLVLDWYEPLLVLWDAIPGGQTGLNFYRDGDHFTARYDFSFGEGDIFLSGNMGRMVPEVWIDGWDVEVPTGLEPISMPSRIERKPLELTFSDFIETESGEAVTDLTVNREAQFDVNFNGIMEYFDAAALDVGYDANGITNPVTCDPDHQNGKLHCTIYPICSDYTTDNYGAVCGTNISLYAVYMGDTVNGEAKAEPKQFNIKRSPLRFVPAEGESLTNDSLRQIMESAGEGQYMDGSSVTVGGWRVDSFLPRQIWGQNGVEDGVYPVTFRYDTPEPSALDQTLLRLEVVFDGGSASLPVEDRVLLVPTFVSDDMVVFELDFGSTEMMDDGRIAADVLEDAVSIKSMTVRYSGSPMIAPASRAFESEFLDFPLKVATLYNMETDLSVPGILQFGGVFASEAMMQSFTIHCSQLFQPLQCSSEPPVEISVPTDGGNSELTDEELWMMGADSVLTTIEFKDQGCWGKIGTPLSGIPLIYVNNVLDPQCYLTAWNENRQIWIAANRY